MNFGPAACRPHELAKLSRLHGGFSPPALPKPAGVRSVRYRTAWGCGVRDPPGPKTRGAAPREGGAKILEFFKRRERSYKLLHVPRSI
nr:MAG TPA: hypothetical protein [Caudoviricetes sp.]